MVLCRSHDSTEIVAECLNGFFGCCHVCRDYNLRVVIIGVVHCPRIFKTIVPTTRRRSTVVLEEIFPACIVVVLYEACPAAVGVVVQVGVALCPHGNLCAGIPLEPVSVVDRGTVGFIGDVARKACPTLQLEVLIV